MMGDPKTKQRPLMLGWAHVAESDTDSRSYQDTESTKLSEPERPLGKLRCGRCLGAGIQLRRHLAHAEARIGQEGTRHLQLLPSSRAREHHPLRPRSRSGSVPRLPSPQSGFPRRAGFRAELRLNASCCRRCSLADTGEPISTQSRASSSL